MHCVFDQVLAGGEPRGGPGRATGKGAAYLTRGWGGEGGGVKARMGGRVFSAGIAALLAGAVGAVPAAATAGLHVVPSPVITNSCLSGAAVIGSADMWAVGDIGTGTGCNPFQTVGGGSGPVQTLAE